MKNTIKIVFLSTFVILLTSSCGGKPLSEASSVGTNSGGAVFTPTPVVLVPTSIPTTAPLATATPISQTPSPTSTFPATSTPTPTPTTVITPAPTSTTTAPVVNVVISVFDNTENFTLSMSGGASGALKATWNTGAGINYEGAGSWSLYYLQVLAVRSDGSQSVVYSNPTPQGTSTTDSGSFTYPFDFSPYLINTATAAEGPGSGARIQSSLLSFATWTSAPSGYWWPVEGFDSTENRTSLRISGGAPGTTLSVSSFDNNPKDCYYQIVMCLSGATCPYQ